MKNLTYPAFTVLIFCARYYNLVAPKFNDQTIYTLSKVTSNKASNITTTRFYIHFQGQVVDKGRDPEKSSPNERTNTHTPCERARSRSRSSISHLIGEFSVARAA